MKIIITESQFNRVNEEISKQEYLKNYFSNDEEVIDEMNDVNTSFTLDGLKNINTFSGRVNYCKKFLKMIASGSGRIVFLLDNDKVVKLAQNAKGIAQNEVEHITSEDSNPILAKVFDGDEYNLFNIMELAKKVTVNNFKTITGVDFKDISEYYWNFRDKNKYDIWTGFFRRLFEKYTDDPDFLINLQSYVTEWDIPLGDLKRLNTYGLVSREHGPDIVIIDYGLDYNTLEQYYK